MAERDDCALVTSPQREESLDIGADSIDSWEVSKEWVGGIIGLPSQDAPKRAEILVWIDDDEDVIEQLFGGPGESLARRASESLRGALEEHEHKPARVRVSSEELAAALRADDLGVEIVCAPTPELDRVRETFERGRWYCDIPEDAARAFFDAAAALARVEPWRSAARGVVADVTIEELDVEMPICVLGKAKSFGLLMFGYDIDASSRDIGTHLNFYFGDPSIVPPFMLSERAVRGWGEGIFPQLTVETGMGAKPPAPQEVRVAEAVLRALPALLERGEVDEDVDTHGGAVRVQARVFEFEEIDFTLNELDAIEQEEERMRVEILQAFLQAPEGKDFSEPRASLPFLRRIHAPLADLTARDVEGVLLDMAHEIDDARAALAELRMFVAYLDRDLGMRHAEEHARLLGAESTAERLEEAIERAARERKTARRDPKKQRARRSQRKAQRKARKKNR